MGQGRQKSPNDSRSGSDVQDGQQKIQSRRPQTRASRALSHRAQLSLERVVFAALQDMPGLEASRRVAAEKYPRLPREELNLVALLSLVYENCQAQKRRVTPADLWTVYSSLVGTVNTLPKEPTVRLNVPSPPYLLLPSVECFEMLLKFAHARRDDRALLEIGWEASAWESNGFASSAGRNHDGQPLLSMRRSPSLQSLFKTMLASLQSQTMTSRSKDVRSSPDVIRRHRARLKALPVTNDQDDLFTLTALNRNQFHANQRYEMQQPESSARSNSPLKSSVWRRFANVTREHDADAAQSHMERSEQDRYQRTDEAAHKRKEKIQVVASLIFGQVNRNDAPSIWMAADNAFSRWSSALERANPQGDSDANKPLLPTWLLLTSLRTHALAGLPDLAQRLVDAYLNSLGGAQQQHGAPVLDLVANQSRRVHAITEPDRPPHGSSLLNFIMYAHKGRGGKKAETLKAMLQTIERWTVNGADATQDIYEAVPKRSTIPEPLGARRSSPRLPPNEQTLCILLDALEYQHRAPLGLAILRAACQHWSKHSDPPAQKRPDLLNGKQGSNSEASEGVSWPRVRFGVRPFRIVLQWATSQAKSGHGQPLVSEVVALYTAHMRQQEFISLALQETRDGQRQRYEGDEVIAAAIQPDARPSVAVPLKDAASGVGKGQGRQRALWINAVRRARDYGLLPAHTPTS